ncbi:MAG: aerobic carbon-monoxide dehydrogenase small subunit [Solirubrobacteraceae bacterium]|nr:aerobic carbon-monoxide dehydrogenase small subunit [Solirubrobacteraceae bacterium]
MSEHRQITLTVNGRARTALVEPRLTLADFLRDDADLKSVHLGCQYGVCGSCTVLVDGESVRSCLMFAVEAEGHAVETVESLSGNPRALHPIQEAFTEQHGLQCGFCTPAMVLRTKELLDQGGAALTREEIREGISGILCRCTGYQYIVNAVEDAQGRLRAGDTNGHSVVPSGPSVPEDEPVAQDKDWR